MYVQGNIVGIRVTSVAVEKHNYYKFWVCVSFIIQHAKRMRRTVLLFVTCLALPHYIYIYIYYWT